jgi:predicted unusual protein kinase regulating ubiquinone biosynthesis (AarF/ABC1/UbiB family)
MEIDLPEDAAELRQGIQAEIAEMAALEGKEQKRALAGRGWRNAKAAASFGRAAITGGGGELLTDQLDNLKGLAMKVGQIASTLDGMIPEGAQQALSRLQSRASPMPPDEVEQALVEAYGLPVAEIFDEFDLVPFAAASIGQVHRAVRRGVPVAVKVQYPGIAKAIDQDVNHVDRLAALGTIGSMVASGPLVAELRQRLAEECDYRQEAAHQLLFRELNRNPDVDIPDVRRELVRTRILATELMAGRRMDEMVATGSQEEKNAVGLTIFGYTFQCVFGDAMFNGDPHPGNYLFPGEGRVVCLDFGCVRFFTDELMTTWKRLARVVLAGDRAAFREAFLATGFPASDRFDYDQQWRVMQYLYEPMMRPKFRYDREYTARLFKIMPKTSPNMRRMNIRPEWLLVQRLQWGMNGILARLNAEGDFGERFRAALDLPVRIHDRPGPIGVETDAT